MSRFSRTLNSFGLYWRTLRHLKFRQIAYRIWYRFRKPKPDTRAAPTLRATSAVWLGCARVPSMIGADSFVFLNQSRQLHSAVDWNHPVWPKLWLYNAHYFDDLNADAANDRHTWHVALIERWIKENPPAAGNGWEPYPSSLRIVNWAQWVWSGNGLSPAGVQSMAVQSRWLYRHLEYHLLGNHLWANAKALCFAGLFFSGPESERWLVKGLSLLETELDEQILPDGGHFERSPMYHSIILADILDLIQLSKLFPQRFPNALSERLQVNVASMRHWLRVMCHPDGDIAFFNDAAFGIAPKLSALNDYAKQLGLAVHDMPLDIIEFLPNSGFIRIQNVRAVLLADVGSVGPSYIPGHAHAGTLSFELSINGQRALVNSGISTYENDPERLKQRGTSSHNTVEVNGHDSSEVWSAFRVARRAKVDGVQIELSGGIAQITASHNGYSRFGVQHQRRWILDLTRLMVEDSLLGQSSPAKAYLHLAPGIDNLDIQSNGTVHDLPGKWYPEFNRSSQNRRLIIDFEGSQQNCCVSWA